MYILETGIYQILNKENGKRYIGSSTNLRKRLTGHKTLLRKGSHHNPYLQHSWAKYGEDTFEFRKLWLGDTTPEILLIIETMYIQNLDPEYNIQKVAFVNPMLGKKHTTEARAKMSAKRQGKDNAMYGRRHTEEAKRIMSKARRNRVVWTDETKQKLRDTFLREGHPGAKVTGDEVLEIRRLYKTGAYTQEELASKYPVGRSTISAIVTNRIWKHIKEQI